VDTTTKKQKTQNGFEQICSAMASQKLEEKAWHKKTWHTQKEPFVNMSSKPFVNIIFDGLQKGDFPFGVQSTS